MNTENAKDISHRETGNRFWEVLVDNKRVFLFKESDCPEFFDKSTSLTIEPHEKGRSSLNEKWRIVLFSAEKNKRSEFDFSHSTYFWQSKGGHIYVQPQLIIRQVWPEIPDTDYTRK